MNLYYLMYKLCLPKIQIKEVRGTITDVEVRKICCVVHMSLRRVLCITLHSKSRTRAWRKSIKSFVCTRWCRFEVRIGHSACNFRSLELLANVGACNDRIGHRPGLALRINVPDNYPIHKIEPLKAQRCRTCAESTTASPTCTLRSTSKCRQKM